MALIGNLDTDFGISASYHNIGFFSWNKSGILTIFVDSYLDEAARLNNDNAMIKKAHVFKDIALNSEITFSDMYVMLKTLPEFSTMANG